MKPILRPDAEGVSPVVAEILLVAIAVVLENQGEGSDWAAPVFRGIVQAYYYGNTTTIPWFGPYDNPYTPTPLGGIPTRTPRAKGRQTPTTP